jgi:hypothetical protein
MGALEVFGFKHDLTGPSDHPVDAGTSTGWHVQIDAVVWNFMQHFHLGSVTGCQY